MKQIKFEIENSIFFSEHSGRIKMGPIHVQKEKQQENQKPSNQLLLNKFELQLFLHMNNDR